MSYRYTHPNECENCGHFDFADDLKEGICKGCREAYPEDFADLDAHEEPTETKGK